MARRRTINKWRRKNKLVRGWIPRQIFFETMFASGKIDFINMLRSNGRAIRKSIYDK